jgi:hypothetical protein
VGGRLQAAAAGAEAGDFTDLVRVLLQPPATAPSCSFPDLLLLPVRSNSSPSYSSSCQNFLLFAVELNL